MGVRKSICWFVPFFTVGFCQLVHAELACDSTPILSEYKTCRAPGNGAIFKLAPNPKCGVELYKSCPVARELQFSSSEPYYYTHVNDLPNIQKACLTGIQSEKSKVRHATLEAIGYMVSKYHDFYVSFCHLPRYSEVGQLIWCEQQHPVEFARDNPEFAKLRSTLLSSPYEVVNSEARRLSEYTSGSDWWLTSCSYTAVFHASIEERDVSCGPETFKYCRAEGNEIENYIEKQSAFCPADISKYYFGDISQLNLLSDKLADRAQIQCPTMDQMPEKEPSDIRNKIDALVGIVQLLQISKNSSGPLTIDEKTKLQPVQVDPDQIKLQSLIEIARLKRIVKLDSTEADRSIDQLLKKYGGLDGAVNLFTGSHSVRTLKSLRVLFPDQIETLAQKSRNDFYKLEPSKYAMFFQRGLTLTDSEFVNASGQIATLDSKGAYRVAEAAILTGFKQIRSFEEQALKLRDLQIRLYQKQIDFVALADELERLFASTAIRGALEQYRSNENELKFQISSLINGQVIILKSRAEIKKQSLWALIDTVMKRSRDSRLPLLNGYRALAEKNAYAMAEALRDPTVVTNADSVWEAQNSVQTLAHAARETLKGLRAVQELLQNTQDQRRAMQQSIMTRINEVLQSSTGADELVWSPLSQKIFENFKGGPLAEVSVKNSISALLNDIYGSFMNGLEKLPDVGD